MSAYLPMVLLASVGLGPNAAAGAEPWLLFPGEHGPGNGKHIVLISGDEEYRSEEGLPQLAKILAKHHGFTCTVLFAIDAKDGTINPNNGQHIPGLEALDRADLMIILTRFRHLPDDEMKHIVDYVESGRPIIGMRTATHAFNVHNGKYARYSWDSQQWPGGFGRQVLGETWVDHHGHHGSQSTRGVIAPGMQDHPILHGLKDGDIWGPTDVYAVHLPLPKRCTVLVLGQVLDGMHATDKPAGGRQNNPMMPVAWTTSYRGEAGKTARVFATTMGASQDLLSAGLRRLLVNASYWCLAMDVPSRANVNLVGTYKPTAFGFNRFTKGLRPADFAK